MIEEALRKFDRLSIEIASQKSYEFKGLLADKFKQNHCSI